MFGTILNTTFRSTNSFFLYKANIEAVLIHRPVLEVVKSQKWMVGSHTVVTHMVHRTISLPP